MPPPIPVELVPHSPEWARRAAVETARLESALDDMLIGVHHIGSTAIAGIVAKPIVDLIPEVNSLAELDGAESRVTALGYQWWGEYGITGRRYCTLSDPATAKRVAQLHCFETGSPHIARHIAFRDYLRANPAKAKAYEAIKLEARELHPEDSHAYSAAKSAWIAAVEAQATRALQASVR